MRIGLDFDNTLAGYDAAFVQAAQNRGLVPTDFTGGKAEVRTAVRARVDGERHWQALQGWVYGAGMGEAVLLPGVADFLGAARRAGHRLIIVSHKTVHGHYDPHRIDLRQAARAWMTDQGFFTPDGFGLDPGDVWFEATRAAKLARIAALGLDCFVDDLAEVLTDPDFPPTVRRFCYGPPIGEAGVVCCPDWPALTRAILGHDR